MSDLSPFFATRVDPPYFATVFSWTSSTTADAHAHEAFAAEIFQKAATVPGFIGVERSGEAERHGIAVTYWETRAALTTWIDRVRPTMARAGMQGDGAGIFDDCMLRVVRVEGAIRLSQMGPSPD